MPGIFKCSYKEARKLVKQLKEETSLLELSKVELVDMIIKLRKKYKKLQKYARGCYAWSSPR